MSFTKLILLFFLIIQLNCITSPQKIRQLQMMLQNRNIEWTKPNFHGLLPSTNDGSTFFYWLFPAHNNPKTAPLMVWLTGGPGCSSELSMFTENGPMLLNPKTYKLEANPFTWNKDINMLF